MASDCFCSGGCMWFPAAVAIGGVFFIASFCRSGHSRWIRWPAKRCFCAAPHLQMVIHTCILLLLVSGLYIAAAPGGVSREAGADASILGSHCCWGCLCFFGISLWLLRGRSLRPPIGHGR